MPSPQNFPYLSSASALTGSETFGAVQNGFPVGVTADQIATFIQTEGGIGPEDLILSCRNETGGTLAAGTLVYISGYSAAQSRPLISKADADVAGASAQWVLRDALTTATNGTAYKTATLTAQDTGSTSVGDPFYLSAGTAGAGTKTAPTGADDIVQVVGQVITVNGSTGTVAVNLAANANFKKIATNEYQALSVDTAAIAATAVTTAKLAVGVISADASGRALFAADVFNAATVDAAFAADAIGEDILTANEITGRVVANVAADNVIGGIPVVHMITIADAASGDTDITLTNKTRVIDAWVVTTAAGDAGNTYTVKNGANAITDAITPGAADTSLGRAGKIDDANWDIAAAGTLRVSHVRNAASSAAVVFVKGVRVA